MRLSGSGSYSRPTPVPRMPVGLVELMEGLTKDVLKHNPPDVYEFCADHMQKLLVIRDGPSRFKTLTIDQRIKKAQDIIKKRSEQRWRNHQELILENNAQMNYLSEGVNSTVDENVSQKILMPVHHEHALKDAEMEISCGHSESKTEVDEHSNSKEKTQSDEADSKEREVTACTISIVEKHDTIEDKTNIHERSNLSESKTEVDEHSNSKEKTQSDEADPKEREVTVCTISIVEKHDTIEDKTNIHERSNSKANIQINEDAANDLIIPKEIADSISTYTSENKQIVVDHTELVNNDESNIINDEISINVNKVEEHKLKEKDVLQTAVHTVASNNSTNQLEQSRNIEHSLNDNVNKEANSDGDIIDNGKITKDTTVVKEYAKTEDVAEEVKVNDDNSKMEISEMTPSGNIHTENTTEIINHLNINQTANDVTDQKNNYDSTKKYNSNDEENKSGIEIYVTQSEKLSTERSDDDENSDSIKKSNELKAIDEVIVSSSHGLLNVPDDISNKSNEEQTNKNISNFENPSNIHKVANDELNEIIENSQKAVAEKQGDNKDQTIGNFKQNKEIDENTLGTTSNVENQLSNLEIKEPIFEINQESERDKNIKEDVNPKGDLNKPQDIIHNVENNKEIDLEIENHQKPVLNMVGVVQNLQNIQELITENFKLKDNILTQNDKVQEVNPNTDNKKQNQENSENPIINSDMTEIDKCKSSSQDSKRELLDNNASKLSESSSGYVSEVISNIEQTESASDKKDDVVEVNRMKRDVQYHDDTNTLEAIQVSSSAQANDALPNIDDRANVDSSSNSVVEGIIIESSDETGHNDSGNAMDLETAAVTIQKVFRNFLFKSRASTFEDSANDENNLSDDDNDEDNKDARAFLPSNMNKDRRTLGISRMDTVLQTVNEEKSLSLSTDDSSLSSAATIIQAHVRGFLVRNKLHSGKTVSSTNSLVNSDGPSTKSLEGDAEVIKNKTILNIHIVPEGNNFLSRDESMLASMDLSLDGSPPSSINLHPLGYDKSERRKQLKREDAIQSISPPSNNSGKLSEDVESVKELPSNNGSLPDDSLGHETVAIPLLNDDSKVERIDTTPTNSITVETVVENNMYNADMSISLEPAMLTSDKTKKTLVKQSSDEMDVVTPYKEFSSIDSESTPRLLHSGEFHDTVLPTKLSRSDTPVVSEFKNVLVYFLLWDSC